MAESGLPLQLPAAVFPQVKRFEHLLQLHHLRGEGKQMLHEEPPGSEAHTKHLLTQLPSPSREHTRTSEGRWTSMGVYDGQ